jgi:hypothetical protein
LVIHYGCLDWILSGRDLDHVEEPVAMTIEAKVTELQMRKDVKYAVIHVPDMRYRTRYDPRRINDPIYVIAEDLQLGDTVTIEIRKKGP